MPVRDTITAPYTGACRVCDLHAVVHAVPGGVHVERCRFLEETNCKGLCTNMCKLPTEKFFRETLGLDMTMKPDYDTFECKLSFGLTPLPVDEDPDIPKGCLQGCSSKILGAQEQICSAVQCSSYVSAFAVTNGLSTESEVLTGASYNTD
eukprot:17932-Heterococcus_DN1.PRE.2